LEKKKTLESPVLESDSELKTITFTISKPQDP